MIQLSPAVCDYRFQMVYVLPDAYIALMHRLCAEELTTTDLQDIGIEDFCE